MKFRKIVKKFCAVVLGTVLAAAPLALTAQAADPTPQGMIEETVDFEQANSDLLYALFQSARNYEPYCDISEYSVWHSQTDFQKIYTALYGIYPELFFLNTKIDTIDFGEYGTGYIYDPDVGDVQILRLYFDYSMEEEEAMSKLAAFYEQADKYLELVNDDMDDFTKALVLHDALVVNNYYQIETDTEYSSNYTFMVDHWGRCENYAEVYAYLLAQVGIPSEIINSSDMRHEWLKIKLGDNYYNVDITWDDPTPNRLGHAYHTYFLRSDDSFQNELEHYGYTDYYPSTATNYDNLSIHDGTAQFHYINGTLYTINIDTNKIGHLVKYYPSTDTAESILNINDHWFVVGSNSRYYPGNYSSLIEHNGVLYFNSPEKVYSYDPATGEQKVFTTYISSSDYLYGLCKDGETLYGVAAATPGESGTLVALGQLPTSYTITWQNEDGTPLRTDTLPYGSTPSYGSTPTMDATAQYTYTFSHWSPDITDVTKNETYTAVYTEIPLVSYQDANNNTQTAAVTLLTSDTIDLFKGWYAVTGSVEIPNRINCFGDVHLILCDGCTLSVPKGITVDESCSLTIYAQSGGSGTLLINDVDEYNACIGSVWGEPAGHITIHGGHIDLTGGEHIVGLGGGNDNSTTFVTITGGQVNVTGGIGNDNGDSVITLNWTDPSDSITADFFSGSVLLTNAFTDGTTLFVAGSVSDNSTLAGKTLKASYIAGHSLSLNGDIGLNFFFRLTAEQAQNASVRFTWLDKEQTAVLTPDATGYYKASCLVAAAEMTCPVTAVLYIDGEAMESSTYSVKQYADKILTPEYAAEYTADGTRSYENLKTLVQAMLDYGTNAQLCFDRNTDNLANDGIPFYEGDVTIPFTASDMSANLENYGLHYEYTSVLFLSGTTLRHYYTVTDDDLFESCADTIFIDGSAAVPAEKDGMIYFEKEDIAASELNTSFTLLIGENAYRYSVMDYTSLLITSDLGEASVALGQSLYRYCQAATVFFS